MFSDPAFSLPTLLWLLPAIGGMLTMTMLTRRAALIGALVTAALQAALLVLGDMRLRNEGPDLLVTSQSKPWFRELDISYSVSLSEETLWLVGLVTLVTTCATLFAWHADRPRPAAFQGLLWLAAGGLTGLFVARDLVLFYVFFEAMLVPLLFLVGVWGADQRVRAAMTMIVYTLVGSLLMLVGIIAVGLELGTFDMLDLAALAQSSAAPALPTWVFVTFLLAFAIKGPLLPLHGWMPLAYREAPVEVAAMLSGVVSKAAMWGFLAVVLPIFPTQMQGPWGEVLTWLCVATLLYGSIVAFRQPDARGVVAYSSMAQMGLIVLGLSVYLGDGGTQGVAGAYLQTINHGLISAALFLLVGLVELRAGTGMLARLGNLASGRPMLATIVLVVGLCALAVPGSNAFAGELLVLAGVFQATWQLAWIWAVLAGLAIVLAAMYTLRLVSAICHTEHADNHPKAAGSHTGRDVSEAPGSAFGGDLRSIELVMVLPLVAGMLLLSAWPNMVRDGMGTRTIPVSPAEAVPDAPAEAAPGTPGPGDQAP